MNMTKIKIGKKEYKVYYAMQPTVQSGIISKVATLESNEWGADNIGELLETITELLLVGLQKFHGDEFGYNTKTGEGKEDALGKAYSLMDEIAEDENGDYFEMYNKLENELLENGFFSKLFRQEQEEEAKKTKSK